jgi:adenosylcobinamide-GDP ribazoletransferase
VVSFRSAKTDGMLYHFASTAHERGVKGALYAQTLLCVRLRDLRLPLPVSLA